jgi:hypothetical protein
VNVVKQRIVRLIGVVLLCLLTMTTSRSAGTNSVPTTNEVVRYERVQPVFRSTAISRERGDRLITILQQTNNFVSWGEWVRKSFGTNVVCVLPIRAESYVSVKLTNGSSFEVGISRGGELVYFPSGLYSSQRSAREELAKVAADLRSDLRREIVNTPKPLRYVAGTSDDGGTLSGVARLFYGDALKWPQIYEANRTKMKNPNLIEGRLELIIPKLK